ncbi:FabD/lysophospholipase-like protein [Xylariaceae sp. FL1651]|nr:FabD/lysophospholipase-like protein [Xylariaceae sp. FL1651]
MDQIKALDRADTVNQIEQDDDVPLPCNYFDFVIGTSTGGLIAIMLGRLRMSVDQCIEQYWKLANKIFVPHKRRFIQHYSRRKIKEAAEEVVKQFCRRHPNREDCIGDDELRQSDYAEQGTYVNKTCKVAVVTVREGGHTTGAKAKPADVPTLYRSYEHIPRPHYRNESNARQLQHANLSISEACQCTTAAPTYFKAVKIKGRSHIDGGVLINNPAHVAWDEAVQMANPTETNPPTVPKLLVSIGTGRSRKHSRFGLSSLVLGALKDITDTETPNRAMETVIQHLPDSKFVRLDVPENPPHPGKGLANIGMDQCKKKRLSTINPNKPNPVNPAEQRDAELRINATEARKGGYKPKKYRFVTFDKIRDRTASYCNEESTQREIQECAQILRDYSIRRRMNNQQRWTNFRTHPDDP